MKFTTCLFRACLIIAGLFAAVIARAQAPAITSISAPRQVVTKGQNLTLSVTATGATSYQWKRSGRAIAGATSADYTITGAQMVRDNGWYQAVATNGGGSTTSAVVFVLVAPTATQILGAGNSAPSASVLSAPRDVIAISGGLLGSAYGIRASGSIATLAGNTAPVMTDAVRVVASGSGGIAVKSDGSLVGWGITSNLTPPTGLSSVVDLALSSNHAVALKADGAIVAWGDNADGQTNTPFGINAVGVAVGYNTGQALKSDGTVASWGGGVFGPISIPSTLTNVVSISTQSRMIALKADGTAIRIPSGEIITGAGIAIAATAGNFQDLILKADGTVALFGSNQYGELNFPQGLNAVFAMAAGGYSNYSLVLRDASADLPPTITAQPTSGTIYAGQELVLRVGISAGTSLLAYQWRLGGVAIAGATDSSLVVPRVASTNAGSYDVVVSAQLGSVTSQPATIAFDTGQGVTTNVTGQQTLSNGGNLTLTASSPMSPTATFQWQRNGANIPGATNSSYAIANASPRDAGAYQVVATNSVARAYSAAVFVSVTGPTQIRAWGSNAFGQATVPAGLTNTVAVAAARDHSIALKSDGTIQTWGSNISGQLAPPFVLNDVIAISAGGDSNLAQRADGSLVPWGAINFLPSALVGARVTAFSAGASHNVAVRSDGTVIHWNPSGVFTYGISNVVGVAAGYGRSAFLRSDGTVVGTDDLPPPAAGLTNTRSIAIGSGYTDGPILALKTNGSVVAWGANDSGQTNVPANLGNVVAVAAGLTSSHALKNDGTVVSWGSNYSTSNELTPPVDLASGFALAAGGSHVLVVRDASADTSPVITTHPVGVSVNVGQNASFSVAATAVPLITAYQWRKGGVNISGATTSTLSFTNIQISNAGSYDVVVTNSVGSTISNAAALTVNFAPTISTQPANATATQGQAASFSVVATGSPAPTYQWRKDGVNISGETGATLAFTSVQPSDAGSYSVVVTNSVSSVTSNSASLTVNTLPTISAHPVNRTAAIGTNATFSVTASGTPAPTYQWQRQAGGAGGFTNLSSGGSYSFVTTANLSVTASSLSMTGDQFRCIVTNSVGSATSNAATLTVTQAPAITSANNVAFVAGQPGSFTVTATGAPAPTFTIASGSFPSWATLDSGTGVISGTPPDGTGSPFSFTLQASNSVGSVTQSFTLTVSTPPTISIQPVNRTAVIGTNATFSVTASGTPAPTYQWQRQAGGTGGFTNLSSGGNYFFVTTANLSVTASSLSMDGDQFRCVVTNSLGSVTSNSGTLTVTQAPIFTSANSTTFTAGQGGSFTTTATGAPAPTFTVSSGNFPSWATLNASTGVISGTPPDTSGSPFTFTIQAGNSVGTTTQSFTLNVALAPGLVNMSSLFAMPAAGATSTFTITGSGTRTLLIRAVGPSLAQFGVTGILADPQLQLYTPSGVIVASNDNWGGSAQLVAAATQVGAFALTSASSKDAVILTSLQAGTYSIGCGGVNATTGTALLEIYDVGGAADTKLYYVSLKTFVSGTLSVGFAFTGSGPRSALIRAAGPSLGISGALNDPSLTLFNGSTAIASNDNWNAADATVFSQRGAFPFAVGSKDSALVSALAPGSYSAQISGVGGTSGTAMFEIFDASVAPAATTPYFILGPASQSANAGTNVTLSALAAGTSPITYQWRKNGADISGATNPTLALNNVQGGDSGFYEIVASSSAGSATANGATLTVIVPTPPTITSATGGGSIILGQNTTFTVAATGTAPFAYQWRKDGTAIPTATNSTYSISNVQPSHAGTYDVVVSNAVGTATSASLPLTVVTLPPSITAQPVGGTVAVGGGFTFSVVAGGSPTLSYQWRRNGISLPWATSASFGIPNAQTWDNGDYDVVVTNPFGAVTSSAARLTVVPRPVAISGRVVIGSGEPAIATFTVEGSSAKTLLLRVVGPGITPFGFTNVVPDPQLDVFDASANLIASNNDWSTASNAAAIASTTSAVGAFGLAAGSRDSVVLQSFAPGNYTVRATGNGGVGGVAYLELYDADLPATTSRIPFVAVRARVAPGDAIMVGGLASNGRGVRSYLIRAAGPALGISGAFANPTLVVARESTLVGSNDDWDAVSADGAAVTTAASRVTAFPFPAGGRDSAIVVTGNLHAGAHTVQVGGSSGAGIVLLELHDLDANRPLAFAPVVVSPPVSQAAATGGAISLTARAHGTAPLSYQWRKDGVNIPSATAQTYSVASAQAADGGAYSVVVTNSLGSATSLTALVTVGSAGGAIAATHGVVGNGYSPGGTVTITNTLSFAGTATGLGWNVTLPAGWSFVSDAGVTAQVKPLAGATGTLGWAWSDSPTSPQTFTYTLAVPATESVPRTITATAIVRTSVDTAQTVATSPNPLIVEPRSAVHSADTNQDGAISLFELTRVIELYNTRNGTSRTGCYQVDPNGEDGFAPNAARAVGSTAALARYHSADTRGATTGSARDGAIDLFELTRVIELYNYRTGTSRTGQYHVQAGTEDGFAPGP